MAECCKNPRVAYINCKCDDRFSMRIGDLDYNGYVPRGIGIGGGDYLKMHICLSCGQIQDFSDDGGLDEFIEDYTLEHGKED